MSWYDGTLTAAAGQLKAILDEKLPLNDFWHIEDAGAGENIGVYHNYDPDNNVDYIVLISDNQADYASLALWAGWDSGAHAGTGASWSSATEYTIRKTAGAYGLSVLDHRFVFANKETKLGYYVGQLLRFDVTKNMPCMTVGDSTGDNNPVGRGPYATYVYWLCLADEVGVGRTVAPLGYSASESYFGNAYCLTSDGRYFLRETAVVNRTSLKLLGLLEGVALIGGDAQGLANLDTVTDENAAEWLALVPATINRGACLIRKS